LRGTKRRRKVNVTIRGKTKVAKRGSNVESGARDVNTHEREKRHLIEKGETKRNVSCGW
jgi:hypothetical protein